MGRVAGAMPLGAGLGGVPAGPSRGYLVPWRHFRWKPPTAVRLAISRCPPSSPRQSAMDGGGGGANAGIALQAPQTHSPSLDRIVTAAMGGKVGSPTLLVSQRAGSGRGNTSPIAATAATGTVPSEPNLCTAQLKQAGAALNCRPSPRYRESSSGRRKRREMER